MRKIAILFFLLASGITVAGQRFFDTEAEAAALIFNAWQGISGRANGDGLYRCPIRDGIAYVPGANDGNGPSRKTAMVVRHAFALGYYAGETKQLSNPELALCSPVFPAQM